MTLYRDAMRFLDSLRSLGMTGSLGMTTDVLREDDGRSARN